jgi:hypothetical protein
VPVAELEDVPVPVVVDDVVVVVDDVVVEVVVGLVEVVMTGVEVVQSRCASWLTVPAPWPRFCTRVVVTDGGRLATALVSAAAALAASPHWWAPIAEETEFS